jgi:hypothetical protein
VNYGFPAQGAEPIMGKVKFVLVVDLVAWRALGIRLPLNPVYSLAGPELKEGPAINFVVLIYLAIHALVTLP